MTTGANVITITVKCDLDLDEIFGRVHVYTTADKSMDWVLDEFCREKNVSRVSTFALRSNNGHDYDLTKTIAQCELGDGDLIFCYNKNPPKAKPPPKSRQKGSKLCGAYFGIGLLFLLISLGALIALIVIYETQSKDYRVYAVVVDAGSTSSKIYLYSWPSSLIFNTGKVQQDVYYKESQALSDSINNPSAAAAPIVSAIQQHILNTSKIPSNQISSTPLYLGATAGMRMLNARNQTAVEGLFSQLRTDLQATNLEIENATRQIRIISGTEEGLDAWITVNYLEGTLGQFVDNLFMMSEHHKTFGSLDLGGASTQISFVPKTYDTKAAAARDSVSKMQLYGRDYEVYSHSFLCYGKSQAQYRILAMLLEDQNYSSSSYSNPCAPSGYVEVLNASEFLLVPCTKGQHAVESYGYEFNVPTTVRADTQFKFFGLSDYDSCKEMTNRLFPVTPCPYANCSINGVYQPELNGNYMAFAGYYHVANFFNATATKDRAKATMDQFLSSVKKYCEKNWETITREYSNTTYMAHYCFDGLYVKKLLTSYGFDNETWGSIEFVNKTYVSPLNGREIHGNTVGWSLGMMIMESGRISVESLISISLPLFIGLVVLFSILLIMSIIFIAVAVHNSRGRSRYNANTNADTTGYGSI